MKIKKYANKRILESISILLSTTCEHSVYDIRNAILQLNSIDDTLLVISESIGKKFSLNELVYLRLKGKDEEKIA